MDATQSINLINIVVTMIIAFITGVGGFMVSKKVSTSTIKKQDSEATSEITAAAINLVKPLREEVEQLRAELKCQQREIDRLKQFERGVYILIGQLKRRVS